MHQKDYDDVLTEGVSRASISTEATGGNALVLTPPIESLEISMAIMDEIVEDALRQVLPSFLTEQISSGSIAANEDDDDFEESFENLSFSLGESAFRSKDFDEAISQLNMALQVDKEHVGAHHLLGKIHLSRSNYYDASKFLLRAGEIDPEDLEIQREIAELHLYKARVCKREEIEANITVAEKAFEKILSQKPDDEEAKCTLQNTRYEYDKLPIMRVLNEKKGDVWEAIIALGLQDNIGLIRAIIKKEANGQPFKAFNNDINGKNSQRLTAFEKYKQYPTLLRIMNEDYKNSISKKVETGKIENINITRYFELQQVLLVINSEFFKKFRYDFTKKIQPVLSSTGNTLTFANGVYVDVAKLFYKMAPGGLKAYDNQEQHDEEYVKLIRPINKRIDEELKQQRKVVRCPISSWYKWVSGIIVGTGWAVFENCNLWEERDDSECKVNILYFIVSILSFTYLSGCLISVMERGYALNALDMNTNNLSLLITRDQGNPISSIFSDKKDDEVNVMKRMASLQNYVKKFEANPEKSPKELLTLRQTVELAINLRPKPKQK